MVNKNILEIKKREREKLSNTNVSNTLLCTVHFTKMNSAEFNSLCRPYKKVQHLADLAKSSKKLQRDVTIDF
jgi:hypothetical protein